MASNICRTATALASPSGSVSGIVNRAIAARSYGRAARRPESAPGDARMNGARSGSADHGGRDDVRHPRTLYAAPVARAHFRLFGIPIRVEPFFVVVAALFGINLDPLWLVFAWVVIVFVSVLVHELGHALTYRLLGQRSAIVLHGFGGFTVPTGGGRRVLTKPKSIAVSVSGAFAQALLLGVPARLLFESDWGQDQLLDYVTSGRAFFNWAPVLFYLGWVSIWWAAFNLLPIRPLDGGHVAEELFGFEMACRLSIGACAVAAFIAFRYLDLGLFGLLFFGLFAFLNYRDLREGQSTGAFDVNAPEGTPSGPAGRRPRRGLRRGRANLQVVGPAGPAELADLTPRSSSAEAERRGPEP